MIWPPLSWNWLLKNFSASMPGAVVGDEGDDLLDAVLGRPVGDRHRRLRQREAGADDVGRGRGDRRRGRRGHDHRRLALGRDRRGRQGRRRDAEAGEHVDLVVDDQLLRDPPRRVGNAAVVLEDHLDLAAGDGRAVLRLPELDRRLDLLAGRRRLAGHGQDEADLERRAVLRLRASPSTRQRRRAPSSGGAKCVAAVHGAVLRVRWMRDSAARAPHGRIGTFANAPARSPIMAAARSTATPHLERRHDDPHPPAVPRRPRRQLPAPEAPARGARAEGAAARSPPTQLRAVEDDAIAEIVKFQEDVGLQSVTDGEFRRTYFHIDFLEQLGGVKTDIPVTIRKPDGTRGARAAGDARDRQGAPRQGHPARRLRVPEVAGRAPATRRR